MINPDNENIPEPFLRRSWVDRRALASLEPPVRRNCQSSTTKQAKQSSYTTCIHGVGGQ